MAYRQTPVAFFGTLGAKAQKISLYGQDLAQILTAHPDGVHHRGGHFFAYSQI